MFHGGGITYEMADKAQAMSPGGIGAIHLMNTRLGLPAEIDQRLELLKFHAPYHESDQVLNMAYHVLCGGVRLEDIELQRNDEVFLNGLGAQRIPDPTTAGDFTRRFETEEDLCDPASCRIGIAIHPRAHDGHARIGLKRNRVSGAIR